MRARSVSQPALYAVVLGLLASAFLIRVVGQLVVLLFGPGWLPPMEAWYSGLVPYPLLLVFQVAILALQSRVSWDLWRGRGAFARRRPALGAVLRWFGWIYLAAMMARYLISVALVPERRWTGGAIPIFFHWVLAVYVLVWSRFNRELGVPRGPARSDGAHSRDTARAPTPSP